MFDDDDVFIKISAGFIFIIVLIGIVAICANFHTTNESLSSKAEQGLIQYEDLSYEIIADEETHIMYYQFSKEYMSPYYSKNGKLCKYEDGKIIEINTDD